MRTFLYGENQFDPGFRAVVLDQFRGGSFERGLQIPSVSIFKFQVGDKESSNECRVVIPSHHGASQPSERFAVNRVRARKLDLTHEDRDTFDCEDNPASLSGRIAFHFESHMAADAALFQDSLKRRPDLF